MAKLTNISKQKIHVTGDEGDDVALAPGAETVVKASKEWESDIFVKAKWLKYEDEDGGDPDPVTVADITGEDGVFTVRAGDGVEFSPTKNQVREDGTLTEGGMKAYEAAKAALSAE